jgi:hypothetical protein
LEVLVAFVVFAVRNTPEGGDRVVQGRGMLTWSRAGGSGREGSVETPSHFWRTCWFAGDRIESEELHTPTSWESCEDLTLKREEVFINKIVEVVLVGPEFGGQAD